MKANIKKRKRNMVSTALKLYLGSAICIGGFLYLINGYDTFPKNVAKHVLAPKKIIQIEKPKKKYAILVSAITKSLLSRKNHVTTKTDQIYHSLLSIGYEDETIQYLVPEASKKENHMDGVASKETIRKAFQKIKQKITEKDEFLFLIQAHGRFFASKPYLKIERKDNPKEELYLSELENLLNNIKCQYGIIMVLSCYAKPFQELGKNNYISLTTSGSSASYGSSEFLERIFEVFSSQKKEADTSGNDRVSLEESIDYAAKDDMFITVENLPLRRFLPLRQCPQLQYQDIKPSEVYPD